MNISLYLQLKKVGVVLILFMFIFPVAELNAQRFQNRGGGRAAVSRPASRPTPSRNNNRTAPSRNNSRNMSRPNNRSINGGAIKSSNKKLPDRNASTTKRLDKSKIKRPSGNSGSKIGDRDSNSRNKIEIDKGNNNVNINVDKSRDINIKNTQVRGSGRVYVRPPYVFGGFRFYTFRPYYYHPYRPFYWGPVWHPWGFFVATLATTAIVISIENQQYHYDQGVYYIQEDDGYRVVQAPVGAEIRELPKGSETVVVNETTNNYYYGGTYYEKDGETYKVVPPTAGTIVPNLPEGGEEVRIGEQTYVQYGDTYYQPVQVDGKDMYEVVEMKEES